jgi:hypothetical protein
LKFAPFEPGAHLRVLRVVPRYVLWNVESSLYDEFVTEIEAKRTAYTSALLQKTQEALRGDPAAGSFVLMAHELLNIWEDRLGVGRQLVMGFNPGGAGKIMQLYHFPDEGSSPERTCDLSFSKKGYLSLMKSIEHKDASQ